MGIYTRKEWASCLWQFITALALYNVTLYTAIMFKSNRNVVYSNKYHVVWYSKYRRKVLVGDVEIRLKEIIEKIKEYIQNQTVSNRA